MKWSHYSEALFDAFSNTNENIIVQACPGAGKTTNIKHLWTLTDKPTVYLVFNKQNQIEAAAKLSERANSAIYTLNSLGHRAVIATFDNVMLDNRKVWNIVKKRRLKKWVSPEEMDRETMLVKAVQVAKCIDTGIGLSTDVYDNMLSTYDLDDYQGMYRDVNTVLSASDEITNIIDYADQLRFPVIYNCQLPQFDVVLGDEVQDFNPVQVALLQILEAKRYVLVGDSHQSIYGFRGAMNDGMSYLKDTFKCTQLPLSITYRCAQSIVKQASAIWKDIEAWEESGEGTVRYSTAEKERYTAEDIVLWRVNRPLIALAYQLLKSGTPCYVRGRDIGEGLVALIKRQHAASVRDLIGLLQASYEVEVEKARVREDDTKIARLDDKYSSALLFCEKAKLDDSPDVVCQAIAGLFSEGKGVCLSTVHKAKGLEAQRALLLDAPLYDLYRKRARQAWQAEQESNVKYVAVTRARDELVYM